MITITRVLFDLTVSVTGCYLEIEKSKLISQTNNSPIKHCKLQKQM